ncbi:protein crumbs homolog 2-like [Menidia menidia]
MESGRGHLNLKTALLTMMMFKWGTLCTATSERCLSSPCQNGASCVETLQDYACICPSGGLRYTGQHCEELYDACSLAPCENCTSSPGTSEYHCLCPPGLTGENCTQEVDECQSNPCSGPRSLCVDQHHGYFCRCPPGHGGPDCRDQVTDCIHQPCGNRGTCVLRPDGFQCLCAPGYEGAACQEEVNECVSQPCQNGAICVDGVAEFHCFCVPGFQGFNCEIDINECASKPCKNNATCINEQDHYQCECLLGFEGINCESEIDECESDPCQNGATCHDAFGSYSCECPLGFEGAVCEVDIDECASGPCENGGLCHDMVNSYECDCDETGFEGHNCDIDIPECASHPCQHGSTCLEGVNGYTCLCWPGFRGPNCEVDIDECAEHPCENGGECFQRSDPSHWELDWELSFADAAGYICQCQPGFAGENCSVNIDECESEPCQNGATCQDETNGYVCLCWDGFLGELCEVNVDECESQPCENGGWCEDGRASYTCHCPEAPAGELPWGGDHCHVRLYGCVDHGCENGATCLPRLEQGEHAHSCLCPHGFSDQLCSTRTTFSMSLPGFVHVAVAPEDPAHGEMKVVDQRFGVQLRFRTTIPSLPLFYRGDADSYLFLELSEGGLHAKAFSEDSELDVTFPGSISDGHWRGVHVVVGGEGLALTLTGPDCEADGCTVTDGDPDEPPFKPSGAFSSVYIGGAPEEFLERSGSGAGFVGCMEDLMIDSKLVPPQALPELQGLELGCRKAEWCESDPCNGHGRCVDLWTSYRCDCHRPFHGQNCSEEFPPMTYSHEDTQSFSAFRVGRSHGSNFSVSFFLKTLKPDGLLFQLRRPTGGAEEEVYFSIYLGMGRVFVSSMANSTPLTAPVFVSSGEKQFLIVEVRRSQVFFYHADLPYRIGDIPEMTISSGDLFYVGGLPRDLDSDRWGGHFKGCLQDLRLDSVHLDLDGWKTSDEVYPPTDAENVMKGCISDDTCKTNPCQNGGECSVLFNDFSCSCEQKYTGKTCETPVWCVSDPCVSGGHCVDLPDGYECLFNATFENDSLQYSSGGTLSEPVSDIYLELRSRSDTAVLLRAALGSQLLLVGLLDSSVWVKIHTGNHIEPLVLKGSRQVADGLWHRVRVFLAGGGPRASPWVITVDGITDARGGGQQPGGLGFLNQEGVLLVAAESFTGCLGAVRVGGVYLPFGGDRDRPQRSQFNLVGAPEVRLGCRGAPVCDPDPCLNGATCEDLFNRFSCACGPGWEGPLCGEDRDDCAPQPCVHGRCRDFLSGFQCECEPGYGGPVCEQDLDECQHHACEHGGACQDGVNAYSCLCPQDYSGPRCQWEYPPLQCGKDVQCVNDGVCSDGLWGANCTCMPGFTGSRCELEIDECASDPCRNGGVCLDRFSMFVCECPSGFSGPICDINKQAQKQEMSWLIVAILLLCVSALIVFIGLTFVVLTARKKRQSEGVYSPSTQELAGARLEMDSMLKVPPEERLI